LKLIGWMVAGALVLVFLLLNASRIRDVRQQVVFTGSDHSFDNLNSRDDYLEVTRKLGQPADRPPTRDRHILYRALGYPERNYT